MAVPKKDAKEQVSSYINSLPTWSQNICNRLRQIILAADLSIVEDWRLQKGIY